MTGIYERIIGVGCLLLVLAACGWDIYHNGFTSGQGEVQARWDKQTAAVDAATTAAVQQAASEALANTRAASVSADAAAKHQAEQADFSKTIIERVKDYAGKHDGQAAEGKQAGSVGTARSVPGAAGVLGACSLDADGLRIWNDANAGRAGGAAASASASAPGATGGVQ